MRGRRGGPTVEDELELRARAERDAAVVAGLLDTAQRRRSARSGDEALTAQLLEAERFAVLDRAPAPRAEERTSARAALGDDVRMRRWEGHESRADCALVLIGAVFLGAGGLALLLRSDVLIAIAAITLVLGGMLLGVRFFWRRRLSARALSVLLDWASHRPGQLGRGLPWEMDAAASTLWNSHLARQLMGVVAAMGVFFLGIGAWVLLSGEGLAAADGHLGVGGVGAGAGLLYVVGGSPAQRAARGRDAALEWLPTSHHPDEPDDEPDDLAV